VPPATLPVSPGTPFQARHLGEGGGRVAPTLILKNSIFVFLHTIFFLIFCPPPKESVKILAPPLENSEMTSLHLSSKKRFN